MQSIWIHGLADGRSHQLTSDEANDFSPAFDPQGRYLYFLSNRDYGGLTFSAYEQNYLYTQRHPRLCRHAGQRRAGAQPAAQRRGEGAGWRGRRKARARRR